MQTEDMPFWQKTRWEHMLGEVNVTSLSNEITDHKDFSAHTSVADAIRSMENEHIMPVLKQLGISENNYPQSTIRPSQSPPEYDAFRVEIVFFTDRTMRAVFMAQAFPKNGNQPLRRVTKIYHIGGEKQ